MQFFAVTAEYEFMHQFCAPSSPGMIKWDMDRFLVCPDYSIAVRHPLYLPIAAGVNLSAKFLKRTLYRPSSMGRFRSDKRKLGENLQCPFSWEGR